MSGTPSAEAEYLNLSEPFAAPGGLAVYFPASLAELMALGEHFQNALGNARFARHYAENLDTVHVYQVALDGMPVSCGEIKVRGGQLYVYHDRGYQNGPGTAVTQQAVDAFVAAANAGTVALNYDVVEGGFQARAPGPTP